MFFFHDTPTTGIYTFCTTLSLHAALPICFTFVLMFVYLAGRLIFGQDWPAGFATTTLLLLMSISMNALFMGVLGEYLGRIFMQSKQRPTHIIEVTFNMQNTQP